MMDTLRKAAEIDINQLASSGGHKGHDQGELVTPDSQVPAIESPADITS